MLPNPEDRKRTLHLLVTILPKPNRDVMEVLFVFLRWVATFSYKDEEAGSLMDVSNLATVITPNILYGKGQNAAKDESLDAIKAVLQLLEAGDDLYRVPPELLFVMNENVHSIFHKDIDLPPKEIHKLCAKYMAARMPQQQRGQLSAGLRNDRPADLRLSGYRSDNSVGRDGRPRDGQRDPRDARDGRDTRDAREMYEADQRGREPTSRDRDRDRDRDPHGINSLRATVSPAALGSNNSRPTSWGAGPPSGTPTTGASTPGATTAPGFIAMPTPQLNGAPVPGASPTFQHPGHMSMQHPLPSPGWRGPFQGAASGASSGSRHSSRGSAPPSPGGPEERRSFNMERDRSRDRSWTPNERM